MGNIEFILNYNNILGVVLTVAIVEPLQEIKNDNPISENNVISYYY